MEFYGGLTYNTFDPAEINELLQDLNEDIPKEELESNEEGLPSFIYGIELAGNLDYIKSTPKELAGSKAAMGAFSEGAVGFASKLPLARRSNIFASGQKEA